jgi:hypothetical protein
MRPSAENIRLASRIPRSTIYTWEQRHEDHPMALAIELWNARFPESKRITIPQRPVVDSASWLEKAWHDLNRSQFAIHCGVGAFDESDGIRGELRGQITRAEHLRGLNVRRGGARHEMETFIVNANIPDSQITLACPAKPGHGRHQVPAALTDSLRSMASGEQRLLLQQGLSIFATRVQKDNLTRFDNLEEADEAVIYKTFLCELGVELGEIQFVSGARGARSKVRQEWRKKLNLASRYKIIQPKSKAYVGGEEALSIRPSSLKGHHFDGGASFRFAMLMAFIVFGPEL